MMQATFGALMIAMATFHQLFRKESRTTRPQSFLGDKKVLTPFEISERPGPLAVKENRRKKWKSWQF
ncbi:MAG: hypothetical protein KDI06_14490 [Calditrichaeota bacterium]|nr:hypothetical protein [Calditrichota bacterium]